MAREQILREKLTSILDDLSPLARRMFERRPLPFAGGGREGREEEASPAWTPPIVVMRDLVFADFEPFVVDVRLNHRQPGWIERESLDSIWQFACRELLPAELADWNRPRRLEFRIASHELDALARLMRAGLFIALERRDRETAADPQERKRFVGRLGGEIVHADARDLIAVKDRLSALADVFANLPRTTSGGELSEALVVETVLAHLDAAPKDVGFLAAGIANRNESVQALAKVAVALAPSSRGIDIRGTSGEPFLDAALSVLDRHVLRFLSSLSADDSAEAIAQLERFHDGARAVSAIVDLSGDMAWRARVALLKRALSESVAKEIERLVPALRQAFGDAGDYSKPPGCEAIEAVRLSALYAAARTCRDTLAVNELLQRLTPVVERAIETHTASLIAALDRSAGSTRSILDAYLEKLIAVAGHVHGETYAACMRRSIRNRDGGAEMARQAAT